MRFYADLHIHSKYSRATSPQCDLEHLALWARKKGVCVVGTGDFTNPRWFREIEEKLVPAEPGLYRLRPEIEGQVDGWLAAPTGPAARFLLEVEISTIYKKGGRTRKVHHLVYVPDLEKARRVIQSLSRIGNLASDGRPILGLDSRDLLEITLEAGDGCYLVPAHVWTPWFAVLGSRSGFDSVEECYGDLSSAIFAIETGLSSDPAMNRRLSRLDRYTLVSNSDAHSPAKIGREACVFDTDLDYFAMRRALETREGCGGTVEFFPEEGKYHFDGHRKCEVCLSPEETRRSGGLCPVCEKPLTLGVMNRVCELADRDEASVTQVQVPFRSLVPLEEVIAEIQGVGPQSKAVQETYEGMLYRVGAELFILESAPLEAIHRAGYPLVAEAVSRMRQGRVIRKAGYDGEYGRIRLFGEGELPCNDGGRTLFDILGIPDPKAPAMPRGAAVESYAAMESAPAKATRLTRSKPADPTSGEAPLRARRVPGGAMTGPSASTPAPTFVPARAAASVSPHLPASSPVSETASGTSAAKAASTDTGGILSNLDPDQREAAAIIEGPLIIIAGPGTGKTRTLTHRIAHLVLDRGVSPASCLAITFTRRAAGEMLERLRQLLGLAAERVPVLTLHALGLSILRENPFPLGLPDRFRVAAEAETAAILSEAMSISDRKAGRLVERISRLRRGGRTVGEPSASVVKGGSTPAPEAAPEVKSAAEAEAEPKASDPEAAAALLVYEEALRRRSLVDFDDLVALPIRLLEACPDLQTLYRSRHRFMSVDEFQDVDAVQYRLIQLLAPPDGNVCVIGDPDQSIYGFRGADAGLFERFRRDFPSAREVHLTTSYRSTPAIVGASLSMIAKESRIERRRLEARAEGPEHVEILECATDRAEAESVVHAIERMVGGHAFFSMDSGRVGVEDGEALSFADFAVLYRTNALAAPLVEAFQRSGIPFKRHSHEPLIDAPSVQALLRKIDERRGHPAANEDAGRLPELLERAAAELGGDAGDAPDLPRYLGPLRALARRFPDDYEGFLSELALGADVDLWDPRAEAVSLLTLHAAKGLEFPVVFVVGCEDGVLPLRWGREADWSETERDDARRSDAERAEERRLFFVGMTRARRQLVLTHAKRRLWRGAVRSQRVSPFLLDIDRQLQAWLRHEAAKKSRSESKFRQLTLFDDPA